MAVACVAIPSGIGFLAAHVGSVFGVSVPTHPLFMIDSARGIEPDDFILRTMLLGGGFGAKKLEVTLHRCGSRSGNDDARGIGTLSEAGGNE